MEEQQPKGIGYLLERTTRIVKLTYSQAFKKEGFDITPEQWVLLDSLHALDGQTQNDLANGSFKDAPTISRILNILEKKGYARRENNDQDKRVRRVYLSQEGKDLVQKVTPTVEGLRRQGWNGLSESEYHEFLRITDRIFDNYSEKHAI